MTEDLLKSGCEQFNLTLSTQQYTQLSNYINLLLKWNKVYNLTAIKNTKEIVIKHVLDSLSIIKYINSNNLIDVGSGGGLPGLIIAIVKPECKVTLLDSNGKKTTFLQQAKIELGLVNVTVVNQRAEDYQPIAKFDTVIARAFASVVDFINVTKHLLAQDGKMLAMKGKLLKEELDEATAFLDSTKEFKINSTTEITVPYLNEERHLIELVAGNHCNAQAGK